MFFFLTAFSYFIIKIEPTMRYIQEFFLQKISLHSFPIKKSGEIAEEPS